jgi:hypothetical protein
VQECMALTVKVKMLHFNREQIAALISYSILVPNSANRRPPAREVGMLRRR